MKNTFGKYIAITAIGAAALLSACKKEYDTPPLNTIPTGNIITMDSLRNMFQGTSIAFGRDMTGEISVYGTVTADEVDGNLYKNLFIEDGGAAINIRLLNSGGVYIGDYVRIYLNGTVLSQYNGMLQLDSVDVDKNIIKQSTNNPVTPLDVNLTDINSSLQSRLVRINNVEFVGTELSSTYADAANQTSQNRTLTDCSGNTLIVRTSGYANYAGTTVAQGNGSIVCIVGEYSGTLQLYIQKLSNVNMNGTRCTGAAPYMLKDFEDNSLTSGGWSSQQVVGTTAWASYLFSSNYFARISNYSGGSNTAAESWLISPSVNLSASTNPELTFINAYNFTGAPLELYISTDYVSGAPSTGTWTQLTGWTLSPGSYTWANGVVNLSSYKTANVHIAFKYTGTNSDGSTWEVDDIMIAEQ